jgi:predicted ABC-type ATPase
MPLPELWIVAGPNGAGKSTAVQRVPIESILPGVQIINPDNLTLQKLTAKGFSGFEHTPIEVLDDLFAESAREVSVELARRVDRAEPIGVETVLSTDKYRSLVEDVRSRNGFVGLIYIALSSPEIAKTRVARRRTERGHHVPEQKVELRWHRSLQCLTWFAKHASVFWIFDNSDSNPESPMQELAHGKDGHLEHLDPDTFAEMKRTLAEVQRPNPM